MDALVSGIRYQASEAKGIGVAGFGVCSQMKRRIKMRMKRSKKERVSHLSSTALFSAEGGAA
jgi:hypothetical protein